MLTNKIFKTILLLTAITAGISNKIMPMGNNTSIVQELSIDDKKQLSLIIQNGDLEAFKTLYKNNPNILQIKNSEGLTPLHFAFQNGHLNIIEFLFKSLDPKTFIALINAKKNNNITPLHFAFKNGHLNIIEFICNLDENHETFISLMNTKDNEGVTPLHLAFHNGHLNIIEFICNLDENHETFISLMNTKDNDGGTPLHLAFHNGHLNIIKFIHEKLSSEDFIKLMNAKITPGHTPLHFAFQNGHLNIIEFIFKSLNPETLIDLMEAKTKKDCTPLHFAFQNGHLNIIEFIFNSLNPETFISLINAKDNSNWPPLRIAFEQGQDKVIEFVYDKFKSIKISDLNNKIIFTEKLLSNNKLLELILNKIKEENNEKLKLDSFIDKNGDTLVSALSKNPKCLSKIIIDNFDLFDSKVDKLLNMELDPDVTVNNNLVSILIYQTLEYCKCNNIVYNIDKCSSTKNINSSDHLQYKKNIETYGKNNTIENTKNFINNFVNNAIVLKLLKKWIPQQTFTNNYATNTEHSEKIPCSTELSNDVIQEHIMGFAGYTYFDNPKNNEVIETLRSKEFNESLINKFANNDTSLTFFPENKIIKDKMEIDK